ncbi:MAG: transcription antitermination factor NusB [Deltaproteobacteria bacterium]|nr:transcription antitermination factor NusB [Deltaproteobacteria bacterium]
MNVRRKARETALQVLYKMDIEESTAEPVESDMDELAPGTEARRYCEVLVRGVIEKKKVIDGIIEGCSENWTIERMPVVDRNILRIAAYELENCREVPYKVIIDEAVELAKRYGSEESGAFINGVLDNIRKATLHTAH